MQKFETTQGPEMYASLQIKAFTTTISQIGEQIPFWAYAS